MKIKNKRALASGVIATAVGILALSAWAAGAGNRFLLAAVLLAALALVNYSRSLSQKGVLEELEQQADERDRYLVMKTSHILLQITNYVLCGATFLFFSCLWGMEVSDPSGSSHHPLRYTAVLVYWDTDYQHKAGTSRIRKPRLRR